MKKIIKSIACICLTLAVAICSCFGAMNLSKNQRFLGTSYNKASALTPPSGSEGTTNSENIIFTGSDIFYVNNSFLLNSSYIYDFSNYTDSSKYFYSTNLAYFKTTLGLKLTADNFLYLRYNSYRSATYPIYISDSYTQTPISDIPTRFNEVALGFTSFNPSFSDGYYESYGLTNAQYAYYGSDVYYYNFGYHIFRNINREDGYTLARPTLNMQYLIMTNSYEIEQYLGVSPKYSNSNIIIYVDDVGYYYCIYLPNQYQFNSSDANRYLYYYQYRRYILNIPDATNNSYYQQGLLDGYNNGFDAGLDSGYADGYSQGQTEGYNNGYTQGLESSERLGFPALITSVIDVPVKVFTNLFNFEILGVNILTFVTSLLTIALILAIVRKVKSD